MWVWDSEEKEQWRESKKWKGFKRHCDELFGDGDDKAGQVLQVLPDNYPMAATKLERTNGSLLVRECYVQFLTRARRIYEHEGTDLGAVLTGQPGIGKSVWLWYVFCRAVKDSRTAVLATSSVILLYHEGMLYETRGRKLGRCPLWVKGANKHRRSERVWMLIDSDESTAPPAEWTGPEFFVLHATSPRPEQYQGWFKTRHGAELWMMPLWTEKELQTGLRLHWAMDVKGLKNLLTSRSPDFKPLDKDEYLERHLLELVREASLDDGVDDDDIDDDSMDDSMDDERWEAMIVKAATNRYGHSARDVYRALMQPAKLIADIEAALSQLNLTHLKVGLEAESGSRSVERVAIFYCLMAVEPVEEIEGNEWRAEELGWRVKFKSTYIRQAVMQRLMALDYEPCREFYHLCRSSPEVSTLAGRMFERLSHVVLSSGKEGPLTLRATKSFVLGSKTAFACTSNEEDVKVLSGTSRKLCYVNPSEVPHEDPKGSYYIPHTENNPLFDSFYVDEEDGVVYLWVFQFTISEAHEGSAKGFMAIRAIRKWLETDGKTVEVGYVLVHPAEPKRWCWRMPTRGWVDGKVWSLAIDKV